MSTSTELRRRRAQRLACAGVGTVAVLVGLASPAAAADGITVSLDPTEVMLAAFSVENFGDGMIGSYAAMGGAVEEVAVAGPEFELVPVRHDGTIIVEMPAGLDGSAVSADLVFDANRDDIPEAIYSSSFAPNHPDHLRVTPGARSVTVELPADDPILTDSALLSLQGVTSTLSPAFSDVYDTIDYEVEFDTAVVPTAPDPQTVRPVLVASSQIPCGFSSYERCPLPTPALPGATVTLDLPSGSVLRELGLSDLSGVEVELVEMDEDGYPWGPGGPVTVEVTGSTASFVLPENTKPGSYGMFVTQETPSGGYSTVYAELTVQAAAAAPVAAPPVNPGLRSNTGVTVPADGGPDGVAVAAGAGMLLLAGAGAAGVARSRRRLAVAGGTCEV